MLLGVCSWEEPRSALDSGTVLPSTWSCYLQLPSLNLYISSYLSKMHTSAVVLSYIYSTLLRTLEMWALILRSLISSWSDKRYNYPSRLQCQKVVRAPNPI